MRKQKHCEINEISLNITQVHTTRKRALYDYSTYKLKVNKEFITSKRNILNVSCMLVLQLVCWYCNLYVGSATGISL